MHRLPPVLQKIASFFDQFCLWLSPMALLTILFLAIVLADGFGAHAQFVQALDEDGVVTTALWRGPSSDGQMGYAAFAAPEHGMDGVLIDLKYYHPVSYLALKENQPVRIRYVYPPKYEWRGALEDSLAEVRGYHGYLGDLAWPLLVCLLILIVQPGLLFLGLTPPAQKPAPPALETPRSSRRKSG